MKTFLLGVATGVVLVLLLLVGSRPAPDVLVVDHGPVWSEKNDCTTVLIRRSTGHYSLQMTCRQKPGKDAPNRLWTIQGDFTMPEYLEPPHGVVVAYP